MKILICGYNDADTIRRTLESVKDFDVHYFDGRFKDFPGTSWESMDGTREIIDEYSNVTFHPAHVSESQCEKRTRMFDVLEEGEYGFKLDSDEVLLTPLPENIYDVAFTSLDVYWGWTISNAYDYPYMKPLIFKKHEGMHYAGRHHYLFDKKSKLITSDQRIGSGYRHVDLPIRTFNIRDRNFQRDKTKLTFLLHREEGKIVSEDEVYGEQEMVPHEYRAMKPRDPMEIVIPMGEAEYTFGLTFSRPWAVKRYFENLDKVLLPIPCEAIVVVDTDNKEFYQQVKLELLRRAKRFSGGIKMYMTGNPPPFEKKRVHERRLRVSKSFHMILTEARADILIGGEDDSLPPEDGYMKLFHELGRGDFVQGTIVGRWDAIIPAWHVEEVDEEVVSIRTGEKKEGVEEIEGMGWYCFMAYTDALRAVKIDWDICKHVGPDWHMGYYMWKAGYKLLHHHDVHVTHFGEDFELTLATKTFVRKWDKIGDSWQTNVI